MCEIISTVIIGTILCLPLLWMAYMQTEINILKHKWGKYGKEITKR